MRVKRKTHLPLAAFLILAALNACTATPDKQKSKETNDRKFYELLEFNDLSERSFVYYQHCLKQAEPLNETFMNNFTISSNLLLDEAVDNMKMPPEQVVEGVLNRRKLIQQKLSEYYYSVGCQSEEGRIASAHYKNFSELSGKSS